MLLIELKPSQQGPHLIERISPGREVFRPVALVAGDDEVGLLSLGHGHWSCGLHQLHGLTLTL